MTERAAHLVDAVLPRVPVRQWVLTVPCPRLEDYVTGPGPTDGTPSAGGG